MQIIRIDKRGNTFGDKVFSSFQEVYDYCLEDLEKSSNRIRLLDGVGYVFKVVDSDETFMVYGSPNGDEYYINEEVSFKKA